TSQYAGEWIAIVEDKIVAHGKDAEKVYKQALKKATAQSIALAKAPEKQLMVLTLSPSEKNMGEILSLY
ncbi:hypothetical protein HY468_05515, partial [Candidatus Roizmanbacteria bacterium]|nr:hypothetical protein [Candidatus Roizmanbacteria bacterium]